MWINNLYICIYIVFFFKYSTESFILTLIGKPVKSHICLRICLSFKSQDTACILFFCADQAIFPCHILHIMNSIGNLFYMKTQICLFHSFCIFPFQNNSLHKGFLPLDRIHFHVWRYRNITVIRISKRQRIRIRVKNAILLSCFLTFLYHSIGHNSLFCKKILYREQFWQPGSAV